MKILIVDDLATNRKLLRVNLEVEGIQTCEAADGVEALAVLARSGADGVISDILMPRMDGYQLCQKMRKDGRFKHLPFIFYTSTYTSPSDERLALDCGADRYIKKPAPIKTLLDAIRQLNSPGWNRPVPEQTPEESVVMREYNEVLVCKLEERNEKLEQARREIALANEALERRVEERTAELSLANQELEAFSHSIAHDLRSPLTAIDGFSYLLVEECRGKVSDRVMDRLRFISEAARRMNELTNDLLRLARANRAEMLPREMNLSDLALAFIQDMRVRAPERQVDFIAEPGIRAFADHGLIRIVLENLLGNAWKYTGKKPRARIEFGVETLDGAPVYFVRDDGAGFDMAGAGKLFTAFCRLHLTADFAGTGIGLSTVHRIVARHGGRIWAEASVGGGAKFSFTLEAPAKR